MKSVYYVLGEKMQDELYGVDFVPDWNGNGPYITMWRGARGGPGCVGATVDSRDALANYSKFFTLAGCEWFLPYAERLSLGQEVSIDEIATGFELHNGGKKMKLAN